MIRKTVLVVNKFWQLPPSNQWLLVQTFIGLLVTIVSIRVFPFHWISVKLGKQGYETGFAVTPEQLVEIRRVRWAMLTLSRAFPWLSTCLTRAITAKFILSQRNIQTTLYLGATLNAQKALEAHAWLRFGSIYVVGGRNQHQFNTLVSYA